MSHLMFVAISHTTSQPNETVGLFQVGVMEEKVKLSNLNNVDSSGSLHQKYQQLLKALQGKDELIGQLEAQLEKQVPCSRAPVPSATSVPIGPSFLSRAPLLDPPAMGSVLPHETILSCGDCIVGRYLENQAGDSVGKGRWRQTDLDSNPTSDTCLSLTMGKYAIGLSEKELG